MKHFKFVQCDSLINDFCQPPFDIGNGYHYAENRTPQQHQHLNNIRPDHRLDSAHHGIYRTNHSHDSYTQINVNPSHGSDSDGWKIEYDPDSGQLHQDKSNAGQRPDFYVEPGFQIFIGRGNVETLEKRQIKPDNNRNYSQDHQGSDRQRPIRGVNYGRNGHKRNGTQLGPVYTQTSSPPGNSAACHKIIFGSRIVFGIIVPDVQHSDQVNQKK